MVNPAKSKPLLLSWPTDYQVITQAFGENPELYARWNVPGYDGVDIRAPFAKSVYAAADGAVTAVFDNDDGRYGRHVVVSHDNGYQTLYGNLGKILVKRGQRITSGQPIATSDGSHMKFVLKREGATSAGRTHFPDDIIDPTPFLAISKKAQKSTFFPWPTGYCLPGVTLPDGKLDNKYVGSLKQRPPEAIIINIRTPHEDIARLRQIGPPIFIMTRLHFAGRSKVLSAEDWVANVRPHLKTHVEAGVTFFEVHHTPNVGSEGAFSSWENGKEFARWWLDVVALLRQHFPGGKFGFPALALGPLIPGQRLDSTTFLNEADEAMLSADWIGVNCLWSDEREMVDERKGAYYKTLRPYFPGHMFFITEFGNVNVTVHATVKEREHAHFYSLVRNEPGIAAAFARD
jgi:hypothetical protein